MNDSCDTYFVLINQLVDKEITLTDAPDVKAHLQSCPKCSALYDDLSGLTTKLNSLKAYNTTPINQNLSEKVIIKLQTEKTYRFKPTFKHIAAALITAALALSVMMTFYYPEKNTITNESDSVTVAIDTQTIDELFTDSEMYLSEAGIPTDEWGLVDFDQSCNTE